MFFFGLLNMDMAVLIDQQDVVWKTYWEWWMIGTDRERVRVREICAVCGTSWWLFIYVHFCPVQEMSSIFQGSLLCYLFIWLYFYRCLVSCSSKVHQGATIDFVKFVFSRQFWFLVFRYLTPLVSSYSILIRWRLLICEGCKEITEEKKKGAEKRYLSNFFISFEFLHGCSVANNVFQDYLNTVVFPKLGIEIHQSSPVVSKFKFTVVMSSGAFMLPVSACRLVSRRHNPRAKPQGTSQTAVLPC